MEAFVMAAATVAAIIIVMAKMGIRKFLGYDAAIDVIVTVGLGALGAATGTFSGLVLGIIAGLILMFSAIFTALKKLLGYEKLTLKGWVKHPAAWRVSDEQVEKAKARFEKSRRERVNQAWRDKAKAA